MSPFVYHLCGVGAAVFAAVALLAVPGSAAEVARDDPFARLAAAAGAEAVAPSPLESLELAGVATVGGLTRVCLADRGTKRTRWLAVGERSEDLLVAEYDRQRDAVLVWAGADRRWIAMRKATIVTLSLPRGEHGAIDWAHLAMTDKEKSRDAEAMVTDILEIAQRRRTGKRGGLR